MKKSIFFILILASLCICLAGCVNSKVDKMNADKLSGDPSLSAFGFGIDPPHEEMQVYEYTGEEIHIPFMVTGMDDNVKSDFGLIVFLDGFSQPYKIKQKNNEVSEEQFMKKFSLKNEEKQEFEIVFTPVTGKEGDRLGIVFAVIFNPDYIPQNENKAIYGMNHKLFSTVSQEIYFKCGTVNKEEQSSYSKSLVEDISQEVKDKTKAKDENSIADGSSDSLSTTAELLQEDGKNNIFYAKNGKAKFKFRIYGGLDTTYHTTIFVNNNPVQVMGSDYIDTTTKKGKMCTIELEFDTGKYERLNTIYAISVPAGKGYLLKNNSPIKTKSILLVND
ncbi:hypothetical protein [Desulfosporosinus sp. OT]|uniref:hypothetical protein n=1 Tax=Desulfosporosinus sp. OT TaxID=913865 RepID=UPI000223A944|nr:hypothetical protein [Desulfosporosinus sp. OT]EGW38377.1 hypothetical protein DOT_3770 [Desulfosporosinus sp. OT]